MSVKDTAVSSLSDTPRVNLGQFYEHQSPVSTRREYLHAPDSNNQSNYQLSETLSGEGVRTQPVHPKCHLR